MPTNSISSLSKTIGVSSLFSSEFDGDLFEFLFEINLLQYYFNFVGDLNIYTISEIRNLTDSELFGIGMTSQELRRLRRAIKKEVGPRSFFRFRKKFSFRNVNRNTFESTNSDRLSLFNPSTNLSCATSQDDSSSIFRVGRRDSSLRHSARHLSLTRCGPAPPLLALLDPDMVSLIPTKILGEGEFATVYQGILRKEAASNDKVKYTVTLSVIITTIM